jgi:hypothetical protein
MILLYDSIVNHRRMRFPGLALILLLSCAVRARAVPAFNKEDAVVFTSATPQAFTGTYPALRLYFLRPSAGASGVEVGSALSADGIAWAEDLPTAGRLSTATLPSVSASSITGCDVLAIPGGFRMEYSIVSTTGAFRIHSATSTDGLHWANDAGTRVDNGAAYLASPKLVTLNDGSWRMYYAGNVDGGTDLANRQILTARSTNLGLLWSAPTVALSTMAYEVGASVLTNGKVRLYYTEPLAGSATATVVLSAVSSDAGGASFAIENGFRISTSAASGSLGFPVPARSTDTFRWRLYYGYADAGSSTESVHSALTGAPAPAAMAPNKVTNAQSTVTFTISGDVFSGPVAPTIQLTSSGQAPLLPVSLVRNDDQTLTATFNVLGQNPAFWDLAVTNSDGAAAALPNALFIDFNPGSVSLVNNLLRPRTGSTTAVTINTFNDGHVTARLFTSDGRRVRTLFDADQPKGALNLTWDGRDEGGAPVASGLYLLHVTAPRIETKAKIIVIK